MESYAPMVELVDTLVLEASASACEFESRLGHHIKTLCSSYSGTPKNLPMSTKARTGHEEWGYRGFKRRREFLYDAGLV